MSRDVVFKPFNDVSTERPQIIHSKALDCSIAIALLIIAASVLGLSVWGLTETYMHGSFFTIVIVSTVGIIFGGEGVVIPIVAGCVCGATRLLIPVFRYQEPAIPDLLEHGNDAL